MGSAASIATAGANSSGYLGIHAGNLAREEHVNTDFDEFKSYAALANQLIDALAKEQIAECLHVMAVHLAEYQRRFGEIRRPDLLELAGATELNDQQANLVRD